MLRRAEEQLRESMQTSADIVAAIPSGLFIYQFEPPDRLVLLSGNPEAEHLTGLTIHQWKGREFNEIWPEAAHRGLLDHYLKVMHTGKMFETEDLHYSDVRLSGAFRVRAFVLPRNRLAVAFENITQRRRAEEEREKLQSQLLQAQKMESIGQLAGGVAHDFNNILAAMLMNLSFARRLPELNSVAHEILEELEREAKRAADLTRQLLLFSRRSVMQKKHLDLRALIGNMVKMLGRVIGEHITLKTEEGGLPVWVEADAGMIEQVIMNLTVNARDAMPKGGHLAIKASEVNIDRNQASRLAEAQGVSFACLTVSDTGCGMDEATIEKIFDPFFTTKDVGQGTGLGLSTVHGIVQQHQGWVEVESTPGTGSLFRIYLPLLQTATNQESKTEPPREMAPGNETILLVEDNLSVRRVLAKLLLQSGYKVQEAGTGSQGLRSWHKLEGKVDLLLTDMMLPEGMSGLDLAEVLRTRKPSLKVIVHSGYDAELLSKSCDTCAGITYVPKPIDPPLLLKAIRDRLDKKE
jgi:two-component system cell cycle sensor histidine kinase/response regulator CckA